MYVSTYETWKIHNKLLTKSNYFWGVGLSTNMTREEEFFTFPLYASI
jgi:hypothetical protein